MDLETSFWVLGFSTTVFLVALLGTRRKRGDTFRVPWFPWYHLAIVSLSLSFLTLLQIISIWKV